MYTCPYMEKCPLMGVSPKQVTRNDVICQQGMMSLVIPAMCIRDALHPLGLRSHSCASDQCTCTGVLGNPVGTSWVSRKDIGTRWATRGEVE